MQKTIIVLQDDLTGRDIPEGEGGTYRFGLDGQMYEIDLDDKNAEGLKGLFGKYINAGRKVKLNGHQPARRPRATHTPAPNGSSHGGDLTADAAKIRQAMAAQQSFPTPAPPARFSSASDSDTPVDPKAVRAWAEAKGIYVPSRGRVKAEIVQQFRDAGN